MPKVGIVIVNYNGEKVQNDCIRSLYAMDEQDFEIIVVDNASSDRSMEILKAEFPKVIILQQQENLGFAAGNNVGFNYCKTLGVEYVLIINNDVEADTFMLGELIKASGGKRPAAPKIYYYGTNTIWSAGGSLEWNRGNVVQYGIHEEDNGQYDEQKTISFATGCCILIPMDVICKCGGFDEAYFMYFEDTDICARWQKAKIEPVFTPKAKLWHKISSSSGGEDSALSIYYIYRNQLYYMKKNSENIGFLVYLYVFFRALAKFLLSPIYGKSNRYIAMAYQDYFSGKMGRRDFGK